MPKTSAKPVAAALPNPQPLAAIALPDGVFVVLSLPAAAGRLQLLGVYAETPLPRLLEAPGQWLRRQPVGREDVYAAYLPHPGVPPGPLPLGAVLAGGRKPLFEVECMAWRNPVSSTLTDLLKRFGTVLAPAFKAVLAAGHPLRRAVEGDASAVRPAIVDEMPTRDMLAYAHEYAAQAGIKHPLALKKMLNALKTYSAQQQSGDYSQARAGYDKLQNIIGANALCLCGIGETWLLEGDGTSAESAESAYRAALALDPAFAPARHGLAVALKVQHKTDSPTAPQADIQQLQDALAFERQQNRQLLIALEKSQQELETFFVRNQALENIVADAKTRLDRARSALQDLAGGHWNTPT